MNKKLLIIFALIVSIFSTIVFGLNPITEYIDGSSAILNNTFGIGATGSYGSVIKGADTINNRNKFMILYETGELEIFQDMATTPDSTFITSGSTGISEVPIDVYGGDIAVSDKNNIYIYLQNGTYIKSISTVYTDISDIDYDAPRNRLILSRTSGSNWISSSRWENI